jgi:hypothetical protein
MVDNKGFFDLQRAGFTHNEKVCEQGAGARASVKEGGVPGDEKKNPRSSSTCCLFKK